VRVPLDCPNLSSVLPQTEVSLKDQAKFTPRLIALFVIMLGPGTIADQSVLRFLSFCASVFDPIFLRTLFFVSARFGFSSLVEIDRIDQT